MKTEITRKVVTVVALLALLIVPVGAFCADKKLDTAVEGFGTSFAVAVYNAHVVVALAADLAGKEVYDAEKTLAIVQEQIAYMDVLDETLKKLTKVVSKEDAKALNQCKSTAAKVREFAVNTGKLVKGGSGVAADDYERSKDKSYAALKALLGF